MLIILFVYPILNNAKSSAAPLFQLTDFTVQPWLDGEVVLYSFQFQLILLNRPALAGR